MTDFKLFPLRLPPNYHGQQKPFRRLSDINAEKAIERDNPEYTQTSVSNWKLKRLDKDVTQQRKQFLVHPAKISQDTPQWFKTTLHHFHRSNYGLRNRIQRSNDYSFTVLNQKRTNQFLNTGQISLERASRIRPPQIVTEKIGMRDTSFSMRRTNQKEITPKIGSVEFRDYSVPHPMLKIGQTHTHNFIDTYKIA